MKIGTIEAGAGQKAFGFLTAGETHGGFSAQIPLHIVCGASDGPVLLVQAGMSGLEIEPALALPGLVRELDPQTVAGTLLLVPLMNMSGFEFEQVNAVWDDKNLNRLGRGKADGTVSEQMIHLYYQEVVSRADALVDIRTGAQWGYYRYAGIYEAGNVAQSRALAVDLGLPQVLLGQPADGSLAFEAAMDGIAVVSAWIGGGPGLRDYREEDMRRWRNAVLNAMRHLGMLGGDIEHEGQQVAMIEAHTVVKPTGARGFTFMLSEKRGRQVETGEQIGYVRHPFTGHVLEDIVAPRAGIMLHAGASWPVVPEDTTLAILGTLVETADV